MSDWAIVAIAGIYFTFLAFIVWTGRCDCCDEEADE
jgi:hypothetical protein